MAFTDADVQKVVELTDACSLLDPQPVAQANMKALSDFVETFSEEDQWEIAKRVCLHIVDRRASTV